MAQHITDEKRRMESRDAHELELLLKAEESAARTAEAKKEPLKKFLQTFYLPKEWVLAAVFTILTIAGLAGAGYWIWGMEPVKTGGINQTARNPVRQNQYIEPQYIFTMKPFFLPKKEKGKATGHFIRVSTNLQLSDPSLNREVK